MKSHVSIYRHVSSDLWFYILFVKKFMNQGDSITVQLSNVYNMSNTCSVNCDEYRGPRLEKNMFENEVSIF